MFRIRCWTAQQFPSIHQINRFIILATLFFIKDPGFTICYLLYTVFVAIHHFKYRNGFLILTGVH